MQLERMQNEMGSELGRKARERFLTIDDLVQKADELSNALKKLSEHKHPLDIRRGLGKGVRKNMTKDRESAQIKGAGRTYFLDVEKTRGGKKYLRITESRKGDGDIFERTSINVFPEDANAFAKALSEMIAKIGQ